MKFIFGAGTYGDVVRELIDDCGFSIDYMIDDNSFKQGLGAGDVPVISRQEAERIGTVGSDVAVAVGAAEVRADVAKWIDAAGFKPWTLIHPSAYVSPSARVGRGSLIHKDAFVWTHTRLGDFVILSPGARVAHHSEIGDFSMLSMSAIAGSNMVVGRSVFMGMGATVMTGVGAIGDGAVIGAGAVVIHDVSPGHVVAGVPAHLTHAQPAEAR